MNMQKEIVSYGFVIDSEWMNEIFTTVPNPHEFKKHVI